MHSVLQFFEWRPLHRPATSPAQERTLRGDCRYVRRIRKMDSVNTNNSSREFLRLDLNLLVVLDALLSEGSVTRAAQRLNLAQPTVSNALSRLREFFQDPLLERSGREMRPTNRGKQLMAPVREALTIIDRAVVKDEAFSPTTAVRTIRVAATDYVSAVILPPLLVYLRRVAPAIRVVISDVEAGNPLKPLEAAEIDLLIGAVGKTSPYIHRQDLFTDSWECVTRKGHPVLRGRITARQFREATHVEVRPQHGGTGGTIDELLAQSGAQRDVALSLPHLFAAPYVLLRSDLVLTVASRIAARLCKEFQLQALTHPLALKPFVVSQLWHQRTHSESCFSWFRKALAHVAVKL